MKTHDKQIKKTSVALLIGLLMMALPQASLAQKANIDVDLLSEIISKKQDEVKVRLVSNLVTKNVTTTNNVTYSTLYHLLNTLTQEKNKTVLTRDVTYTLADYAVVSAIEAHFFNSHLDLTNIELLKRNPKNTTDTMLNYVLRKAYSDSGDFLVNKQLETGKLNTVNKEVAFGAQLHNYLIDTFYVILAKNPWLHKKGFFKLGSNSELLEKINHDEFIFDEKNSESMARVRNQISTFMLDIETNLKKADTLFHFVNELTSIQDLRELSKEQAKELLDLIKLAFNAAQNKANKNLLAKQIFSIIETYIIIDLSDDDTSAFPYNFKIDVEAVIWTLAEKFEHVASIKICNTGVQIKPFFTIGLNQGRFLNTTDSFEFENETKLIKNFSFASEKIGLKFVIWDFKYTHSFGPNEPFLYRRTIRTWPKPVVKDPFISNIHATIYGSGLLYNIVNLKSEKNFKYAIAGVGTGMRFYNGLEMNVSYAIPLINNQSFTQMNEKAFLNVGFDIPIFEYLSEARD